MRKWIAILLCTALLLTALTVAVLAAADQPQSSTESSRSTSSEAPTQTDTPATEQTTEYCGRDDIDVDNVCDPVGASANVDLIRQTDEEETHAVQPAPDAAHGAWSYSQAIEQTLSYEADGTDTDGSWLDAAHPGRVPKDGFHLIDGRLHLAQDGRFILLGSGSYDGVSYTCEDGICTADAVLVRLADGKICVLKDDGTPWLDRGYFEYDGALYFGRADGTLLRNKVYQTMRFGADGKYTSGNKMIDKYIDGIVASVTNVSMTQRQKLKECYAYISSSIFYQPNNRHVEHGAPESTWTESYMLRLIERGKGNCYSFASEMYYLARRLGYWQARAISGMDRPDGYRVDHGWVELDLGEETVILDPEMNNTRELDDYALFMIPYSETPWTYYPYYPQ